MRPSSLLVAVALVACKAPTSSAKAELPAPAPHPNLETVMGLAIYAPDPGAGLLKYTQAAARGTSGRCGVGFCVGVDGRTNKIETSHPFPDDPEVDRICTRAVEKWAFKPHTVEGTATEICTTVSFELTFIKASKRER